MDESKSALRPCPFCGGEAVVHAYSHDPDISDLYYVFCKKCVCRLEVSTNRNPFYTKMEAIEAWNRRAERKKGKWIVHDYTLGRERYECTECKGRCDLEYNFCPHCGAQMTRSE